MQKKLPLCWGTIREGKSSFGHTQCDTDPILILCIRFTKPLYWWEKGGKGCGRLRKFGDSDTGIRKVSGSDQQSAVCSRSLNGSCKVQNFHNFKCWNSNFKENNKKISVQTSDFSWFKILFWIIFCRTRFYSLFHYLLLNGVSKFDSNTSLEEIFKIICLLNVKISSSSGSAQHFQIS